METEVGLIGVEQIKEHEDGSADFEFHFDDDTRDKLAQHGLELVLHCAAAEMDIQDVLDWIRSHIKTTEYQFDKTCVSCNSPSQSDFCEFCLTEE